MRLLVRILLPALVLMAVSLSAEAAGHDRGLPLQVGGGDGYDGSPTDAAVPAGPTAFHDLAIGDRTVSVRLRYAELDLIDTTALASRLGARLLLQGDEIIFDRPTTGERVHLDRSSGTLKVNGVRAGQVDAAGIIVSRRVWLSASAIEALTGETLQIAGRSRQLSANVGEQGSAASHADSHQALITPDLTVTAPEARLMLASFTARRNASGQALKPRSGPGLSPMRSFEGALGGKLRDSKTASGRLDWHGRESWAVLPTGEQSAPQTDRGQGLANVPVQHAGYVEEKEAPASVGRTMKTRKTMSRGLNQPLSSEPAIVQASFSPQAPARPVAEAPEARPVKPVSSSSSGPEPYRGTALLYETATISAGLARPASQPDFPSLKKPDELSPGRRGEIRGRLVVDTDADGLVSQGDQHIEGEIVQLIRIGDGVIAERRSAAFGQFGFAGLSPGRYRVRVMTGWQEHRVDVGLSDDDPTQIAPMVIAMDRPPDRPERRS